MGCFWPIPAYRTSGGGIDLWRQRREGSIGLRLPCGGCLGCREDYAKSWALRNFLEMRQHDRIAWTTLTYDEEHCPPTLEKQHLSKYIRSVRKRLGPARPIRFFACGEYGEKNGRPHFHAVLYGLDERASDLLQELWKAGYAKTVNATPATIAYTAGYVAKKIGWKLERGERVDYETGEIYTWQPPFLQMSRRPGIGASARAHVHSWRTYAVYNGTTMAVPRYLHEAWKAQATEEEIAALTLEKSELAARRDSSPERRRAEEIIARKRQEMKAERRKL